jgi:anti-anti-sigma regulatory factor
MTQDSAAPGHLLFEGALTMRTAHASCATLLAAIARHPDIRIDCTAATEVDLTFIQLLVAARVSGQLSQKSVVLAGPPQSVLLEALTRAGFRPKPIDSSGTDVWFEEVRA